MNPKRCDKLWPFTGPIPDGERRRCTLEIGHAGPHTIIPPSGMDYAPDDEPGIEPPKILYEWTDALGERFRMIDGPRPMGIGFERSTHAGEWAAVMPSILDSGKAILGLLCEVRRLSALYDGEKQLRRRDKQTLLAKLRERIAWQRSTFGAEAGSDAPFPEGYAEACDDIEAALAQIKEET